METNSGSSTEPDLPSAGPCSEKCGALHLEKTGDLFLLITLVVAHYFGISGMQKIRRSFCGGPLFVGAPVRPNMLNMPKSATDPVY